MGSTASTDYNLCWGPSRGATWSGVKKRCFQRFRKQRSLKTTGASRKALNSSGEFLISLESKRLFKTSISVNPSQPEVMVSPILMRPNNSIKLGSVLAHSFFINCTTCIKDLHKKALNKRSWLLIVSKENEVRLLTTLQAYSAEPLTRRS